MVYFTGGMVLSPIRTVFNGQCNDVVICRDFASPLEVYYTLVSVKDRECARRLLSVFEEGRRSTTEGTPPYIACFSYGEELCYLFPYKAERRLSMFGPSQIRSALDWETICINLVMECLSSPLPYPLLALTLEQDNIHISQDNTVSISAYFDLSELKPQSGESVCARKCIETMLSLLSPAWGRSMSAALMIKKLGKNAYTSLAELYRDIKVTAQPPAKRRLKARLRDFWKRNKDRMFRLLVVLSAITLVFALLIGISQLIFGDIPIFRLFEDCFGYIGTRRLS